MLYLEHWSQLAETPLCEITAMVATPASAATCGAAPCGCEEDDDEDDIVFVGH